MNRGKMINGATALRLTLFTKLVSCQNAQLMNAMLKKRLTAIYAVSMLF